MLNFNFPGKGLQLVSLPPFEYDFFKTKCFSCYILLTDQISLSDYLYFLRFTRGVICFKVLTIIFSFLIDFKMSTGI